MKKILALLTFGLTGCTVTPSAYVEPAIQYRPAVVYPTVGVYPRHGFRYHDYYYGGHREYHGRHHDD